jgi:ligand-binding sensor domain-containing protein/anti-sigma regulatory factor (Ser/Thr protein kinase)
LTILLWWAALISGGRTDLLAQKENIRFERISLEHGLSQSTVNCILEDHEGFMWFGTQDGLNKYDGYKFTIYRHEDSDSNSLSDSYIRSICEDHEGILWVGTSRGGSGGGLNRFDPDTKKFTRYRHDPKDSGTISHNYINAILGDISQNCLWIGTANGFNRFNPATGRVIRYLKDPKCPQTISDNYILSIFKDREGIYWIGTANGLNRFDPVQETFTQYLHDPRDDNSLSDNYVLYVREDHFGNIWIATFSGGLNRLDKKSGRFTRFRHNPGDPSSLAHDHVECFYEDKAGFIWVGTDGGGLSKLDPRTGKCKNYFYNAGDPESLSNNRIWSMYGGNDGVIWFGNYAGGINKLDRANEKFRIFKNEPNEKNTLFGNIVFSVFEDEETGRLWVGTDDAGLNAIDIKTGVYSHYANNTAGGLKSNQITVIMKDSYGTLWCATSSGVYSWDPDAQMFLHLKTEDGDYFTKGNGNLVLSMMEDKEGNFWFGTDGAGVYLWERKENRWSNFRSGLNEKNGLRNNVVWSLYQESSGIIWLGTEGGLAKFSKTDRSFTCYQSDPANRTGLSNNKVFSFCEDRAGRLWIATSGGFNRLIDSSGRFERFTEADGLANNCVYSILEDRKGRLWMSTNNGISVFDPNTLKFKNYDAGDGLPANEFATGAYFKNANGRMYFGCINGFVAVDPDSLIYNQTVPPIVITAFTKLNKEQAADKPVSKLTEIELAYHENVFSFEFVALNYVNSDKNQYAYKLDGFDKDWVYCGSRRFASYTNLDPGTYVFRAKGSNNDGLWNEAGASIRILVLPPPWQTWWFKLAALLLITGIAYAAYHYRVNKLLELERLRTKIASDLHDDVGATLTKISLYSDLIKAGVDPVRHQSLLSNIAMMSRDVITTMSDIVWSIDSRNDRVMHLLDRMSDFAQSVLSAKNIALQFRSEGFKNDHLSSELRQNIYLILKESINNIAKHAQATNVDVWLRLEGDTFIMQISDNGIGIPHDQVKSSHGLRNMAARARRIHGRLEITNNDGTKIKLTVIPFK